MCLDIISKINKEHLNLLEKEELNDSFILEKLLIWQTEYDFVDWIEFKDSWFYCYDCESYNEGQCICYAR